MISIISMAIHTAISFLLYILKAVFSMLLWFLKSFVKCLKIFFSLAPATSIVFVLFFILSIVTVSTGGSAPLPTSVAVAGTTVTLSSKENVLSLFESLKAWWTSSVLSSKGTSAYILMILLTILMFVPVVTVFLCISVFSSFGQLLFYAILVDVAIYLIRAVFAKSFVAQFLGRYYFLFPDSGKKHYEKSYSKWLRRHHEEFENDSYEDESVKRERKISDFYGESDEDRRRRRYQDDYDEDYEDDGEDYYPEDDDADYVEDYYIEDERNNRKNHRRGRRYDDYNDGYDNDEEYEDEDFYGDDEGDEDFYGDDVDDGDYYEDGSDEDYYGDDADEDEPDEDYESDYDNPGPAVSFNFFAGCNSRESVEKKYRSLAKLYHPDNMDGDTASLQEINAQYELAKKRFPR